jgi:predicted ATP-grasp superfamily ATP-dependent carboligase
MMLDRRLAPQVLVADAKWFGTLAAVQNLGAHGVGVTLASDSLRAPARWSRYVGRTVSCPSSKNASEFLAWLLRFGSVNPGHVLYPTSDEVAWLVAAHFEALSRVFCLYTPRIETIVQLLDKARLMENARAAGLDVPKTRVPRSASEVEWCGRDVGFPLYLKPRSQVFGQGLGKGAYVENAATLLQAWMAQYKQTKYEAEVLDRVPDMHLPVLQSCVSGRERIYTVDGFVDETGELYISLACVKILQLPRGSGAGIVFEHAKTDPEIDRGLRKLFQATGYYGVFDAEFIECEGRKLLIDVNPRFYNHMAFEIDRGLPLAWLAYLAAIGDRENLKSEIKKVAATPVQPRAYVHRLPTALLLLAQRLGRGMSREEQIRWRRWISKQGRCVTDPARAAGDPGPALAEVVLQAFSFLQHPRSYLRGLWKLP